MSLYAYVVQSLAPLGLAYLHLIEPRSSGIGVADVDWGDQPLAAALFRPRWLGVLITAGGFSIASANEVIADAIGLGRAFIANPDLLRRIRIGAQLNAYERPTCYTAEPRGHTDYPALE